MNQFEYTIAMKKIPTLKTKKAKVEFIREIHKKITATSPYTHSINCSSEDFYVLSRFYRVYKSAFLANPGEVPIFLEETLVNLREKTLEYAIRGNIPKVAISEAMQFEVKDTAILAYSDLSDFLRTAMKENNRLTLANQLRIIDIVRDSCEPS